MWVVLCCIILVSSFGLNYDVGRDVVEIEVCFGGWCVDPVCFLGL